MAKADIELLFGVAGGGSVSGASGAQIKGDLDAIVNAINAKPYDIKIQLDQKSLLSFKDELAVLTKYAIDQAQAIKDAYKGIDFPQIQKDSGDSGSPNKKVKQSTLKKETVEHYNALIKIDKLQKSIRENARKWSDARTGAASKEFKDMVNQISALEKLKERLNNEEITGTEFNKSYSQISSIVASSANSIHAFHKNTIELKSGTKEYDQALISVNSKLVEVRKNVEAWSAAANGSTAGDYDNLKAQIVALEDLQTKLKNGRLSVEEFTTAFSEIKREASSSAEAIKKANKAFSVEDEFDEYEAQLNKVNTLLVTTRKNLANWTAAKGGKSNASYRDMEQMAVVLEQIRAELIQTGKPLGDFKAKFNGASTEIKQCAANIKLAGEDFEAADGKISKLFKTLGISFTIADVFSKAIEIGREMVDVVTEIDTAMTELKKVTDETEATYDRFLTNAKPRARALGATVADTVSATADFARLGHGIDAASSLADAAIVYKNVGDGIEDITTASESIVSTMQAFGIEAKDAMTIVDSFNNVGNNFAVSSQGIGEALLNSAAALDAAGNNIHESIALIAAANTTIQDPGRVGTALKTMSMYMRAAKTEAEEAGLSTENMAGSVSELREELLALTGNKVDIMANVDAGEYKSTVEILRDLSEVWEDLSDTTKTNITELIGGGVRNANIIASLMKNFNIVEDAMKTSENSTGSALAENEKYLDSIAGKMAQLQSSVEVLYTTVLSSEVVKMGMTVLDILTRILTVISDVAFDNFFSTLTTIGAAAGGFAFFKNLG